MANPRVQIDIVAENARLKAMLAEAEALIAKSKSRIEEGGGTAESALKGATGAAKSFGAGDMQIVFGVMVKEAMPSIVLNWAVVAINLLGYSAMAGVVGGGGLGDLAIKYGYNRFQTDVMIYSVAILIVIVQAIQSIGNRVYEKIK